MLFSLYAQNYEDVMLWRALREETVHTQALEKSLEVTGLDAFFLRSAPGQRGVTPAI